jgi:nucleobase:cation symporter-1, NCS1 family
LGPSRLSIHAGLSTLQIETHSIDFVPAAERYGTPRRLFTVWFSTNMTILGVALGTLGIAAGLSLGWTLAALAIGNAVGTVFMAAHSAQGPQLGVPQMIQSRAQFGVRGAAIPLCAVVATYVLYCAANGILIEGVLCSIFPISSLSALVLFSCLTAFVAFVGYELIHRLGTFLTVISSALFGTAAWLLWSRHHAGAASVHNAQEHFTRAAFLLTATQAASWSLSYGPYVADYSRYLPQGVSARSTFSYTGLGCFVGSFAIMAFGAYFSLLEPALAQNTGFGLAALFGSARPLIQVLVLLGVLQGNVLNLYSAYMSSTTIFTSSNGARRIPRTRKLLIIVALIAASGIIAALAKDHFQRYFADSLNVMLYLLAPWSAINLADYYLVRRGRYNIGALYDGNGEYGAFRWRTIGVYCMGVAVQVPFMALSFYEGIVARQTGTDIAWLPGLLVSGVLYTVTERVNTLPCATGVDER